MMVTASCPHHIAGRPALGRKSKLIAALLLSVAMLSAACSSNNESTNNAAGDDSVPHITEGSVFAGREMPEPSPKPEIVLTDTNGDPFDLVAETEGTVTFLYFGYTFCPDICPVHMAQLSEILAQPDSTKNVRVVFVTVDPDRDTPEVLRSYLDKFDRSFIGLTGTPEEIEQAQIMAGVMPAVLDEPNPNDPDDYTVGHAAQVIAYAPNGLNYTQYPFGTRQSQFAHDLPILLKLRDLDDTPEA